VGNAYITGYTNSTDFPTMNPLQPASGGGYDAFVAKINPAGSGFVYSTYLGGSGHDSATSIAVDSVGNAYVTGFTFSTDFPTVNPLQPANGGLYNAFVSEINPTGSALVYSTYLGGSSQNAGDEGTSIAVDSTGNAYVTGVAFSTDFPTMNPLQPNNRGLTNAFVTKFNPSGSALVYSTYLGGSGDDFGLGIAVDNAGNAYVTGGASSTNFPTMNPLQPTYGGGDSDAFVAKISPTGSALVYSTYLGGTKQDDGDAIAVDSAGNVHVGGTTASRNFPTMNPLQPAYGGGQYDAFVAELNPEGSALVYATYLGGNSFDVSVSIAVDSTGNVYVTGQTFSGNFPTTPAAFQTKCNRGSHCGNYGDAFVARLNTSGSALVYST